MQAARFTQIAVGQSSLDRIGDDLTNVRNVLYAIDTNGQLWSKDEAGIDQWIKEPMPERSRTVHFVEGLFELNEKLLSLNAEIDATTDNTEIDELHERRAGLLQDIQELIHGK